ncbi:hypothetical protein [Legionella gresilensis]|uniref:hypothetical protein n=1 Tax=Legionella gresilensis TaxID=91823 RepID=UPI001041A3B1|nr:hypothetical protein [Legionella gresilensis]
MLQEEKNSPPHEMEQNNTTILDVPDDVIGVIASKYLSLHSIFSLRLTSKKFASNPQLKAVMDIEKKRLQIAVHAFGSFYLWEGKVFAVGRPYRALTKTIEPIPIPSDFLIRAMHMGSEYAIFGDMKNNYFEFGKHLSSELIPTYAEQIKKIELSNGVITKVATGDYDYFICDSKGQWHHSSEPYQAALDCIQKKGKNITDVVHKNKHTCLRDSDGRWYGFGKGELFGTEGEINEPVLITLPTQETILDIKLGKENTFIRGSSGQWFACGRNSRNQLGSNAGASYLIFKYKSPQGLPIEKLAVGDYHVFACDTQGQWYFSGGYIRHQSNDSKRPISVSWEGDKLFEPINLPNSNKIIKIITGTSHTFYLDNHRNWYVGGPNISHDLIGLKESTLTLQPQEFNFFELANISDSENSLEWYESMRF